MRELMRELVKLLNSAGMPSESCVVHDWRGVLTVAGVEYDIRVNYRGTVTVEYVKFRRARVSGYNMRKIVNHIIACLPSKLEAKDRIMTVEAYRQVAADLTKAAGDLTRFEVTWFNGKFTLRFTDAEQHVIGMAIDFLQELQGENMALPENRREEVEVKAREYVDSDGMVRSLANVLRSWAWTDEEVDRIANMIVGEVFVADDLRLERTQ